jgi:hypothetical protein
MYTLSADAMSFKQPLVMLNIGTFNTSPFFLRNNAYTSSDVNEEKVQIETLTNFKYNLKKPITVNIVRDKFDYIGDIPELELYSYGSNKFEVLRELNEEITELFEKLISMKEDELGKFPKKWKNILEEYFE